jgi:hypothetical protein
MRLAWVASRSPRQKPGGGRCSSFDRHARSARPRLALRRSVGSRLRAVSRTRASRRGRTARGCRRNPLSLVGRGRQHSSWRRRRNSRRRGCRRRRIITRRGPRNRARFQDRQEGERVDIALFLARSTDAEMDEGDRQLDVPGRPDSADDLAFRDRASAPDRVRAEVYERDRVAVLGLDRDRLALPRDSSRKGDRARDRRKDRRPRRRPDVNPAVLPGVVRAVLVEREERQHRPVDRPAPAKRRRWDAERGNRSHCNEQTHLAVRPPLSIVQTSAKVARPSFRCQI